METKRPEVMIISRNWEPGEAIQIVLVRPDEVVKTAEGGVDLEKTPSTSYLLLPGGLLGGFAGVAVNRGG